jgi:hypothetical protein
MSLCRVRGDSEGRLSTAQQASLRRFSESTGRVVTLGDACPDPRPAGKMAGLIGPPRSAGKQRRRGAGEPPPAFAGKASGLSSGDRGSVHLLQPFNGHVFKLLQFVHL